MHSAGDRPGKGNYFCMICGKKVVLENDDEELPTCPKCGASMYH